MTTPSCIEPQTSQKCTECGTSMPEQGWVANWTEGGWPDFRSGHEGSLGWYVLLSRHGYDDPHKVEVFCPTCRKGALLLRSAGGGDEPG